MNFYCKIFQFFLVKNKALGGWDYHPWFMLSLEVGKSVRVTYYLGQGNWPSGEKCPWRFVLGGGRERCMTFSLFPFRSPILVFSEVRCFSCKIAHFIHVNKSVDTIVRHWGDWGVFLTVNFVTCNDREPGFNFWYQLQECSCESSVWEF